MGLIASPLERYCGPNELPIYVAVAELTNTLPTDHLLISQLISTSTPQAAERTDGVQTHMTAILSGLWNEFRVGVHTRLSIFAWTLTGYGDALLSEIRIFAYSGRRCNGQIVSAEAVVTLMLHRKYEAPYPMDIFS